MTSLTIDLIIGSAFVILAVIWWAYLAIRLLMKYNEDKKKTSLFLGLAFLTGVVAGVSLLSIHLTLTFNVPPTVSESPRFSSFFDSSLINSPRYGMTGIAIILAIISSSLIFIFLDWFTLSFQDNKDLIIIVPAIPLAIFVVLYLTTPFTFQKVGNDWQTTRTDPTISLYLLILLVIPLFFSGVFMLFTTLHSIKDQRITTLSIRMGFLTIGLFVFITSYVLEVATPPPILTILARFGFFIFGVLMYIGIMPPQVIRRWLDRKFPKPERAQ